MRLNKVENGAAKPFWTLGREAALGCVLVLGGFFVAPYAIVGVAPLWLFLAYALTMRRAWRWCAQDERKWPAVLFVFAFLGALALVCYCLSALLGGGRGLSVVGYVVLTQVVFWVLAVSCIPGYAKTFESFAHEKFGSKGLTLERGASSQANDARMRESGTADKDKLMADEFVLKPLNKAEGLLADVADKWRILGGDDGRYEATAWQICMTGAIADVALSLVAKGQKLPSGKKERRAMKTARKTIKKALAWTPPARPERPARSQEQSCDEPGENSLDENELVVNQVDEDYALERVWRSLLMVCSLDEMRDDQIDDMIARADVVLCRVAELAFRVKRVAWWNRMTPEERAKIDSMIEILTYPRKRRKT